MRLLAIIGLAALLGGIATSILFALGWAGMAGVAYLLGALALTSGFTIASGPISTMGMTDYEPWPRLWLSRRGGHR